jgi:hypothetical protein
MRPKMMGVFLAAVVGWAQAPEIAASTETKTTFATRVDLVVVPVVVRDRKGRAVGNLTREDFQLFDRGKPQSISRFSVEKAGEKTAAEAARIQAGVEPASAGSAAIPTRFIAYLFDDMHIELGDLMQIRAATIQHLTPPIARRFTRHPASVRWISRTIAENSSRL